MKKLFLLLPMAAALVLAPAPADAILDDGGDPLKLKVTICHWANGNVHAISPSISAVLGGTVDTKHGLITLDLQGNVTAFVAHDVPGHELDTFLHFGKEQEGDDEKCVPTPPTTTPPTTAPPVVIEKEVIKEVPVEKVVEVPVPGPTMVIERTITVEKEVPTSTPPAMLPKSAPTGELPRTGGDSMPLAGIGASVTALGLFLRRLFK